MESDKSYKLLIDLLKLAYSGERSAAYAYIGHANSVRNAEDRDRIHLIEKEEWHHREIVGDILKKLGHQPSRWKEIKSHPYRANS